MFKDLNRNGKLDPYEDWRLPATVRANDLLARMTVEEKAGTMMHAAPPGQVPGLKGMFGPMDMAAAQMSIRDRHVTTIINRTAGSPVQLAEMDNALQAMAEDTRLGIPMLISSDPRNHLSSVFGTSIAATGFSQWPEATGLAAIGDEALVRRFGQVAAREYRAVGIRMTLSPQADLATEPRWSRISSTFGDNGPKAGRLARAYVEGFQGGDKGVGPTSVAAIVKHWVGYGAEPGGYDAHNPYGRDLAFPGGAFRQHIAPFLPAFAAHVSGVIPTYARPPEGLMINGRPAERVGAGFSRQMLTELLRDTYHFDGIVLSDFLITADCGQPCMQGTTVLEQIGMPWGVEALSKEERFAKAIDAGIDQFGGVDDTAIVAGLIRSGRIGTARIDGSVRRLLIQKFHMGLFENAYVDPAEAGKVVGTPASLAAGVAAQERSVVLLENKQAILPLSPAKARKVWLWHIAPDAAKAAGFTVVDRPEDADVAILHIATPFTPHPPYLFGIFLHEGSTAYATDNPDRQAVERASAHVPTIVVANLDRAAILTPIRDYAAALLGDFGISDSAPARGADGASQTAGPSSLRIAKVSGGRRKAET